MSQTRVILQARTSSARLPGKVLLPVNDIPLVVLAAQRAANTGLQVLVATSDHASDDALADTLSAHAIPFVRGPLENVHARFLEATKDLTDEDWIVRLTADNLFPDGAFIESILSQAQEQNLSYLGTDAESSGLPFGMSCEVFRLQCLRATADKLDDFDREHVTPAIKRTFGAALYLPKKMGPWSHLRCTVDTLDDYLRATSVFEKVSDPIATPHEELISHLVTLAHSPAPPLASIEKSGRPLACLTLGTAQLGLEHYGRANVSGQPNTVMCQAIVETALRHGITHFDCARAYGTAEHMIGEALATSEQARPVVITKLSPLSELPANSDSKSVHSFVDASVRQSCAELQTDSLAVLMLHRWSHRTDAGGAIWERLQSLQADGVLSELGASVSTAEEALQALNEKELTHLQIPCHLGDHRWSDPKFLSARAARPDVSVYGRSAFLQGVLLAKPALWPAVEGSCAEKICQVLDELVEELGRESRADLCLAYAQGCGAVDSVVVGQETLSQLTQNIKLARRSPLDKAACDKVRNRLPQFPHQLLDPSQWPTP